MMAFGTQIQHGPYSGSLHTPDCDARDGEGHTHWHACGELRSEENSHVRVVLVKAKANREKAQP